MANFDFITDRLATGGDITSLDDLDDIVTAGITHIIDNRFEWNDASIFAEHAPHITYLHNGVDDAGGGQPDGWYRRGVTFAAEALATPGTKVLAHCHMGINRGPSMAFAILLGLDWDPVAAYAAIQTARPVAGILYADDALAHHLRTSGVTGTEAALVRRRFAAHERDNRIDIAAVIRRIRLAEAEGLGGLAS